MFLDAIKRKNEREREREQRKNKTKKGRGRSRALRVLRVGSVAAIMFQKTVKLVQDQERWQ